MSQRAYYFGCWNGPGHFLHKPGGDRAVEREARLPWSNIDGRLCPGGDREACGRPVAFEVEGRAALHHLDGWTALAFWDRSVDHRFHSNSVFFVEGTTSAEDVLRVARERFPEILRRLTFAITVVSHPSEVTHADVLCSACGRQGRATSLPGGWAADPPGWLRRGDALSCSPGCAPAGEPTPSSRQP